MKPEFSGKFNAVHAKAGAPYCQMDGLPATVIKWDMDSDTPLLGFARRRADSNEEVPAIWRENGIPGGSYDSEFRLVMLPLGLIDGKPVYVGDELDYEAHGKDPLVVVQAKDHNFDGYYWPAPVLQYPQYPVTRMSEDEMEDLYRKNQGEYAAIVNAAIARCFADGDAVLRAEHEKVVTELFAQRTADSAYIDCVIAEGIAKGQAERDLAVARAIRDVCMATVNQSRAARELLDIDLASIVASVSA
jgi:hypothetical protein